MKNFAYLEFAQTETGKPIDGMAAGNFRDMWGRGLEIKPEELATYIKNTNAALKSTVDESGQIVGFPIDINHDHDQAVGWIKRVFKDAERDVVKMDVEWNAGGEWSIETNTYRYFSPSVNDKQKVIVGGGLTNWPATRDEKENILLRPVELSQGCYTNDNANLITGIVERVVELVKSGEEIPPVEIIPEHDKGETHMDFTELMADPEVKQKFDLAVAEQAKAQAKELSEAALAKQKEDDALRASVAELKAKGLPIEEEKVTAYLLGQTKEQRESGIAILRALADAGHVLDFSEHGHQLTDPGKKKLEPIIAEQYKKHLELGGSMEEFFSDNPELGETKDYDLSEYKEKTK